MFRRLCQIDLTLSFFPFQKQNESPVIWCNQRDLLEDEYWQKYLNDNDYDKKGGQHAIHQSVRVIISAQIRDWITQHGGNEAFNKSDLSEHHDDVLDVVDVGGWEPGGRQSQLFLLGQ